MLSLVATYPLLLNLDSVVSFGDSRFFLWTLWWWKHSLMELHTDPFHTNYLCYPHTIGLYMQNNMPSVGIASIPLQYVFSLERTYNILALLSFVLCGYGMYLLCRHIRGSSPASFLAGALFAFMPLRFQWMNLGWLNILNMQWIPFYCLYLLKTIREGGWRNATLAGVFLALTAFTHLEFLVFEAIFTAVALVCHLLMDSHKRNILGLLKSMVLAATIFLIASSLVLVPSVMEVMQTKYVTMNSLSLIQLSADAAGPFIPPQNHILLPEGLRNMLKPLYVRQEEIGYLPETKTSYVGYVTILLAAYGIFRKPRECAVWAATAVIFYLLSLGPTIQFNGKITDMPSMYALSSKVPLLNLIRYITRYTIMVQLSLAAIAALGFTELMRNVKRKTASILLLSLLALALADSATSVTWTAPIRTGDVFAELPRNPAGTLYLPGQDVKFIYLAAKVEMPAVNCRLQRRIGEVDDSIKGVQEIIQEMKDARKLENRTVDDATEEVSKMRRNNITYVIAAKPAYRRADTLREYLAKANATTLEDGENYLVMRID